MVVLGSAEKRFCGFVATGDEFCRHGDVTLEGGQQCSVVESGVLLWDEDCKTQLQRVVEVLKECRAHGITIKAEFMFAS